MDALHLAFYSSRYINEDDGMRCPACRAYNITSYGLSLVDGCTAVGVCMCAECGATWQESYALTGISDLKAPEAGR